MLKKARPRAKAEKLVQIKDKVKALRKIVTAYPKGNSIYYLPWWAKEYGKNINSSLRTEMRRASDRNPEPSATVLDNQSGKTKETPACTAIMQAKK